jgi:hypothetical protein
VKHAGPRFDAIALASAEVSFASSLAATTAGFRMDFHGIPRATVVDRAMAI